MNFPNSTYISYNGGTIITAIYFNVFFPFVFIIVSKYVGSWAICVVIAKFGIVSNMSLKEEKEFKNFVSLTDSGFHLVR